MRVLDHQRSILLITTTPKMRGYTCRMRDTSPGLSCQHTEMGQLTCDMAWHHSSRPVPLCFLAANASGCCSQSAILSLQEGEPLKPWLRPSVDNNVTELGCFLQPHLSSILTPSPRAPSSGKANLLLLFKTSMQALVCFISARGMLSVKLNPLDDVPALHAAHLTPVEKRFKQVRSGMCV